MTGRAVVTTILTGSMFLLAGCATTQIAGMPIGPEKLAGVHVGMTETELIFLLGKATLVEKRSSGRSVLRYEFGRKDTNENFWTGRIKTLQHANTLYVLIEAGMVLDYTFTERTSTGEEFNKNQGGYYPIVIPIPM